MTTTLRSSVQTTTDWKDKYFKVLFELDEREKQSSERVGKLSRALLRTVLLFHGRDPAVDKQINLFANALKSGQRDGSLLRQIDAVVAAITEFDKTARTSNTNRVAAPALVQLLEGLEFPEEMGEDVAALISRLSTPSTEIQFQSQTREILALLRRAMQQASDTPVVATRVVCKASDATAPLRSFVDHLELPDPCRLPLAPLQAALAAHEAETRITALAEESAELLSDSIRALVNAKEYDRLALDRLKTALSEWLKATSFPQEVSDRIKACLGQLEACSSASDLHAAFVEAGEILRDLLLRLQHQVEDHGGFLRSVLDRLKELQEHLERQQDDREASTRDRNTMTSAVAADVLGIRQSVHDAKDLDDLRRTVESRLQTIDSNVSGYALAEKQRADRADVQLRMLQRHVRDLEVETQQLKQTIISERVKASLDPLTGLPNRLAYDERIAEELARWRRYGSPLSMCVIDIDHFKRINDSYGHQAGDRLLNVVATQIARNIRESDFLCRYGGEEFVLVLPATALDDAGVVAEKLRSTIENCQFHHRGQPVRVTISCGVAEFRGPDDPETVFERADESMYRAKSTGRNRCLTERVLLEAPTPDHEETGHVTQQT